MYHIFILIKVTTDTILLKAETGNLKIEITIIKQKNISS